jgi:hypothetical protein
MPQATVCECLALDPFAFEEDGIGSSEVDVGRHEIAQALVIAGMVAMSHEGGDLTFEIAGQVIVLEQDAVLERDPKHAFKMGPMNGLKRRESGRRRTGKMRQKGDHSVLPRDVRGRD